MKIVFVHGWSVTDTGTYGLLPEAIAEQAAQHQLDVEINHVWLGRYISFHDEVTMSDIARAFDQALRDTIPKGTGIAEFSCITHSTGGPVVREWLEREYGAKKLKRSPLRHLVMLAPANHGSALAKLGKQRVGRMHAWWNGVEPGQRVLDWLALGSRDQFELSRRFLDYQPVDRGLFPFVLTGQHIDTKLFDFVNGYLTEPGSDGVVRVAGANLNYSMVKLTETDATYEATHIGKPKDMQRLELAGEVQRPRPVALGVVPKASHSGTRYGIMGAVDESDSDLVQVTEILKCLQVNDAKGYEKRRKELARLTKETQTARGKKGHRYTMIVFVVKDDQGDPVNDFDLMLLGHKTFDPGRLSRGFFVDRQQNTKNSNHLIYYVDYDVITKNKLTGFRIVARPSESEFGYYLPVEFRAAASLNEALQPNETLYVEVELRRRVNKNVFRLDNATDDEAKKTGFWTKSWTRKDFKDVKPEDE